MTKPLIVKGGWGGGGAALPSYTQRALKTTHIRPTHATLRAQALVSTNSLSVQASNTNSFAKGKTLKLNKAYVHIDSSLHLWYTMLKD